MALRSRAQKCSRLAPGPTVSVASGKAGDDEVRVRNPGSVEAERAAGEAGARHRRAQRDDGRVVGAAQDRVRAAGDPVQAISGTSKVNGARRAAGISRRSWPQSCIGQCAGVGAVAGAPVTGVVRMHAPGFPNAMSAKGSARQRDAETTSLALAKAGARAAAELSAPRRMRVSATSRRRVRRERQRAWS